VIHYHGTPITPRHQLYRMAGRHFCVSFARPDDLEPCLQIGQSVMLDNGAFSAFTRAEPFDLDGYVKWVEPVLAHPHWAVIPDVIDGTEADQDRMIAQWPRSYRDLSMPVWHLGLPIQYLLELAQRFPRICFGSSAAYWDVGSDAWCGRMDEAFNALAQRHHGLPWVHGLRMLGMAGQRWPLASADSSNVAQNHTRTGCAECMAAVLDSTQCRTGWKQIETQQRMFA
jgi:hypothetical protein